MSKHCRGCHNSKDCSWIKYSKWYFRCPCSKCLVFVMCREGCDKWEDYVSFVDRSLRQRKFRIRAWPIGRLRDRIDARIRKIKVFIRACKYSINRWNTLRKER